MEKCPDLGSLIVYKNQIITALGKGYYWNGVTKATWTEMVNFIEAILNRK